jgi:hypothetical protein
MQLLGKKGAGLAWKHGRIVAETLLAITSECKRSWKIATVNQRAVDA